MVTVCNIYLRTPKCHPELDGEGIEYSWGRANKYYKLLPLDNSKGNKISKKVSKRPYQYPTLLKSVFVCFLVVQGDISLHKNYDTKANSCRP